jgi:tripartite ATP-independent transporter DctM subunit
MTTAAATAAATVDPIGLRRFLVRPLLCLVDTLAALFLAAALIVILVSVFCRYVLDSPIEWSGDVATMLLVALSFFGAAGAVARGENVGIAFFVERLPPRLRQIVETTGTLATAITAMFVALYALYMGNATANETTGSGLPLDLGFYPMAAAGSCMAVFAFEQLCRRRSADIAAAILAVSVLTGLWHAWSALAQGPTPQAGWVMLATFVVCLAGNMPIGFVLAFSALIFIWTGGSLPGVIFAQQMARGIDNFILLAIPFFILIGYLMEANGMSVRLIEALERLVGRRRGGLNIVMVLSMVVFSGISGSKAADVAAVGTVLIPAARRSRQNPGSAVALLAASAVMAETIPPCINLIILGFVANLSIGGLFMAGMLPAGLMALALIAAGIVFGPRVSQAEWSARLRQPMRELWTGVAASFGLIAIVFGGFKSGFATATEISAFGALYALLVGGFVFRELTPRAVTHVFIKSAVMSGLILFIIGAAQAVTFVLTLQGIPQALAALMIGLAQSSGTWMFLLLSIAILIVMGSVLEGAAALIIFGPLLLPVAVHLGIDPLHYGILLVVAMGLGLFAPPLGLGLYTTCLIGGVTVESATLPMLRYLGLLFLCLLVIAFVPALTLWLPRAFGY